MAYGNYYQIAIRHEGLGKYRMIRGGDRYVVEATARAQERVWNEQYAKKLATEERQRDRRERAEALEERVREAADRTDEAQAELNEIRSVLGTALRSKERIDWEKLKQLLPFSQSQPAPRPYLPLPAEPQPQELSYQPRISIMGKIIHSIAEKNEQEAHARFEQSHKAWEERVANIQITNNAIYENNLREFKEWQKRAEDYEKARIENNEAIERRAAAYRAMLPDAIIDYGELVLSQSKYPDCCPRGFELDYDTASKTLVVDYQLPEPDELPSITDVKFIRTRNDFVESKLTKKQSDELYEDLVCQIALRSIHELYREDSIHALNAVVFNGDIKGLDPGTGNIASRCIMSVRASRNEFQAINLLNVQARACFETLGGVAGKKFADGKKIKPFMAINLNSERFSTAETISSESSSSLDEWQQLVKSLTDHTYARFVDIQSLASVVGFPPSEKYSAALSRELAGMIAARGYGIEPDARFGAAPYLQKDEVVLFRPINPQVSKNYIGAAVLLKLCMMIAAADDDFQEMELKVAHDFIKENGALDDGDRQRLSILELLLRRNPGTAKRSLSRISKRLSVQQRQTIGEVLVCVAGADGKITSGEWATLDNSFKALDLAPTALDDILHKLGAQFSEPVVQQAEPAMPGEMLPAGPSEAVMPATHQFTIDMTKVARISQETSEVIGILSAVMNEDEKNPARDSTPLAQRTSLDAGKSSSDITSSPATPNQSSTLGNLPEIYKPVMARLITKNSWSRTEFGQLASEFKLMPLSLFDTVNEWSDENLGDFLLDGEDPITLNMDLLSKETLHE